MMALRFAIALAMFAFVARAQQDELLQVQIVFRYASKTPPAKLLPPNALLSTERRDVLAESWRKKFEPLADQQLWFGVWER